jgi:hypothetical protein
MAVIATVKSAAGQRPSNLCLTESRLSHRFKRSTYKPQNEHIFEVLGTALGDEEDTPQEDLDKSAK